MRADPFPRFVARRLDEKRTLQKVTDRECKPGGFFKIRVCGFDGLQTRVPRYPGSIMSVRRPARVDGKPTASGHLSETQLRSVGSCRCTYATRRLMEVS